jgi:L,D-transpeptidase catalytic domain
MSRTLAVFSIAIAAALAACSSPGDMPVADAPVSNMQADAGASTDNLNAPMSPGAARVAQIAARYGDRDYLMVDKSWGEVFLFRDGKPVVRGSALTGANPADILKPGALNVPFSRDPKLEDKVTPAGRFTVAKEPDHTFGVTLNVNEIQGADWDIAIHKIFLGFPQEHRDTRLASSDGRVKHITFGCIDISNAAMQKILQRLPDEESTPLYIVPTDERHIAALFPPTGAVSAVMHTGE